MIMYMYINTNWVISYAVLSIYVLATVWKEYIVNQFVFENKGFTLRNTQRIEEGKIMFRNKIK